MSALTTVTSELSVLRPPSRIGPWQISDRHNSASSASCTLFVLLGGPPCQLLPQSARREDDGEERGNAEREECPDKEEGPAGLGDRAADSRPLHVDDRNEQPKERPEEDDYVPRSPFGQHQGSVQPNDQAWRRKKVGTRSPLHSTDDVVSEVKRHEQDREQRRDG